MRDYVAAEVKRKLYEWRAEDAKAESDGFGRVAIQPENDDWSLLLSPGFRLSLAEFLEH
jgi:hypothetical protein